MLVFADLRTIVTDFADFFRLPILTSDSDFFLNYYYYMRVADCVFLYSTLARCKGEGCYFLISYSSFIFSLN